MKRVSFFNIKRFIIVFSVIAVLSASIFALLYYFIYNISVDSIAAGQFQKKQAVTTVLFFSFSVDLLLVLIHVYFILSIKNKQKYADHLYNMSYIDSMTGAKNRQAYFEDIRVLSMEHEKSVGIIFCDLNGLKKTNDDYGHEAGDALINEAVVLLTAKFNREEDELYRIGGDEFVIICKKIIDEAFYEKVQLFIEALEEYPIMSIGEVWLDECIDIESQIKEADEIMYRRKTNYYLKTGKDRRR